MFRCLLVAVLMLAAWPASVALSADDSTFETSMRPADRGSGYSIYSSLPLTSGKQYTVSCNCADFSLDQKTCANKTYSCYCVPKAVLTCQ
ncbi:hypothetical protein SAMN02745157_3984 [Kaistia soli DSM 19436]|uniref:Uncharacterized protein n=1 Tax=Kaistia soli DSM 19436 TaxID=1122133 RepID=A0A1M5IS16_9HYPH|nr:hypothetical protein [Kaistia soli]SHG31138.1 hypothetical protein SAMN02745157_3984 [Kaistia soli DSM 19436]